jgi:hypothetical protein
VDATRPQEILEYFRELSLHVRTPTRLVGGGSVALLLRGYLARRTDYIDVVDELPSELRTQNQVLDDLARRFGLRLAHFQSHYLPDGWERQIPRQACFETCKCSIDVYDVFAGKLFSARSEDLDDIRAVLPKVDRSKLVDRVKSSTAPLRSEQRMLDAANHNWYVLFGEELPG